MRKLTLELLQKLKTGKKQIDMWKYTGLDKKRLLVTYTLNLGGFVGMMRLHCGK